MADQSVNNAVAQNPEQNRLRRIEAAQTYHSPVEQDIRQYKQKAAAINPAEKPIDTSLQDHVNAAGVLEITVRPPEKKQEGAKGSQDAPLAGDPAAVSPDASAAGSDPAAVLPRRSITKSGGVYVVEDRADGPYVIARQPAAFSPIRAYDKGVKVDEDMLMPDDERNFLEKTRDAVKSTAVSAGDASTGALEGIGIGQTKLVTNALRTLVDNPVGDFTIGADKVQAFEDFTNKFLTNLDKEAGKSTKTKAGKVAQTGGEIAGQFVMPTIGLYGKLKAAGANPIAASLLAEGMVAIAGVNPDDQNLSDMIADDSKFKPIKDLIGTDPASSDWENRAKNAVETFALMGIGEAAGRGIIKAISEVNKISQGIPDKAMGAIDRFLKDESGTVGGKAASATTDLPEFKAWFEGSKVVDNNGDPLVVYHGTTAGASENFAFDASKIGQNFGYDKIGFFFTDNKISARSYSRTKAEADDINFRMGAEGKRIADARIISAYISIKKPITGKILSEMDGFKKGTTYNDPIDIYDDNRQLIEKMLSGNEYDGVILKAGGERLIVAKSPEQIKSTMNKGSFNPADPRIQYGVAGAAGASTLMSPEEAEANVRTEVLQKAIALLNDVDRPAGQSVIKADDVKKMIAAADQGVNPLTAGIDFNLTKIENAEQLGATIDEVSEIYKDKIFKGKRGVQTFDMTQTKADMSREMGFDVEAALSRRTGEMWPDYKIKAARDMFVAQVEKTRTMALAIKAPGGNSDDALIAFRKEMAVTAALQMQIKGAQTEVARALSQFRMTAKSPLEAKVQIREMIDTSGGAQLNEEMVDAFLNAVENGGPDAAAIFARQGNNVTTMDMLYEAWINSLLGSPQTHLVNLSGNSLAAAQGVAERYAAAGYGALERAGQRALGRTPQGGITFDEANAYAAGLASSVFDALRAFGKAAKSGQGNDIYGKLDYNTSAITAQNVNELPIAKSIAGRLGKDELLDANSTLALTIDNLGEYYYRLPGRMLMAEDQFFKTINYRAELSARAAREASVMRQAGASADEIDARRLEVLRDPQVAAPDIHLGSIDHMREQTFTTPPGKTAAPLQKFFNEAKIGDFPAGRIVVPFFNVINNITKYSASRVPGLALVNSRSKTYQDLFSGDAARRQLAMGKWATGGAIMGATAYMTMNGQATGRLSDNPKVRAQMEAQGKKPFSVVMTMEDGSTRAVQYNRLDPLGMQMGIAASTAEVMHYASEEDREMLAIAAVSAVLPYMEEKSFFSGAADFMNAMFPQYGDDDSRIEAVSKYVQKVGSSLPGAIGGPLAPGTPLSGFLKRELGDDVSRMANPSKFRIEKDAWGDDILVPNGPEYRAWEGMIKKIMSRTPGLSSSLPARKNLWGEDQILENGIMGDGVLSPLYSAKLKYDFEALQKTNLPTKAKAGYFYGLRIGQDITPEQFSEFVNIVGVDGELERLGAPLSMPKKMLSARNGNKAVGLPVDLNDQQYADYLDIMNNISVVNDADPQRRRMNMKQALDWIVKEPAYAKMPEDGDAQGSKSDVLRLMAGKYRDAATNLFFSEHKDGPALMRRSVELKLKAQNTGAQ